MIGGRESTKGKLLTHTTRKRKLDTCVEVDILFLILLYTQHSIVPRIKKLFYQVVQF